MNEHPEELLAAYVEGSLDANERARIETHLRGCDTCREEVELASGAREALASLPQLDPPRGIAFAVRRRARGAPSRAWRIAGTAAAAAVLAAGAIVVFSNIDLGSESASQGADSEQAEEQRAGDSKAGGGGAGLAETGKASDQEGAPALAAAPLPTLPIYVESGRQYESKDLAPLARRLRDDANALVASGLAPTATSFFADFDPSGFSSDVRRAIRCVLTDVPPQQLIVPFRIESATFQDEPAYVAAFLQGPTPEDPYDRLVMWVVHRESCDLISLASQVL